MATKHIDHFDPKIVEQAKVDSEAFGQLYDYYFPKMYAFITAQVGDKMTAEDVVSNVFMKVLENLSKYQNRGLPFGAWLFKVARNVLFDHYAKSNKSAVSSLDETMEIKDGKKENSPLHQAKQAELKNKVVEVMNKLPDRELSVLQMKFFSGLTNREIAVALDLSEQNVGIILYRVLRKIKPDLNNLF